jgi:hypothetical protein
VSPIQPSTTCTSLMHPHLLLASFPTTSAFARLPPPWHQRRFTSPLWSTAPFLASDTPLHPFSHSTISKDNVVSASSMWCKWIPVAMVGPNASGACSRQQRTTSYGDL